MQQVRQYTIEKVFVEGGKKSSFTIPVDCKMVTGLLIVPQLPAVIIPDNKPFLLGTLSVLLNNKNDNSIHDFPLYAYPDANGIFSLGNDYSAAKKTIRLSTQVLPGTLISFIYKDSNYMLAFKDSQPLVYGDFDFDIDINLIYHD